MANHTLLQPDDNEKLLQYELEVYKVSAVMTLFLTCFVDVSSAINCFLIYIRCRY